MPQAQPTQSHTPLTDKEWEEALLAEIMSMGTKPRPQPTQPTQPTQAQAAQRSRPYIHVRYAVRDLDDAGVPTGNIKNFTHRDYTTLSLLQAQMTARAKIIANRQIPWTLLECEQL